VKTYRIVLIVLLIAAVVGGAWYCMTVSGSSKTPENGTLVESDSSKTPENGTFVENGTKKCGCQWG
jgi:lipopolysaccharide export system protein LptC